ncbi:MAG: hypothetical protein ACXVBX_17375 [Flavisolibacter sp.]
MVVLQIEHPVPNYDGWKKAFESDPVGRRQGGVVGYSIFKTTGAPQCVIVDLEFAVQEQAEAFLESLKKLWGTVEGTIMNSPKARILEVMETHIY